MTDRSALQTPLRFRKISRVDLIPDEFFYPAALRSDSGIANAQKRIEHRFDPRDAVQSDAPFGELNRKRRRMRSFLCAALNCLVGNEPRVAATT